MGVYWAAVIISSRAWYQVRVIVPDGFRGVFSIVEDRNGIAPTYEGRRGGMFVYAYNVPDDGVLASNDVRPLTAPHRVKAISASGEVLAVAGYDSPDLNAVLLRELGGSNPTPDEYVAYFIIGTSEEAQQFHIDHLVWHRIDGAK
jgi:hypothetical protein